MILTLEKVKEILSKITFKHSCVDMGWKWTVVEVIGMQREDMFEQPIEGFLINTTFQRPDINTGIIGRGSGRQMWIPKDYTESGVVMTAWLCAELIVRHELMESFLFDEVKILNPHKSLKELAFPETIKFPETIIKV